ncbi:hypothetical protein ACFLR7_04090 [Acidobacteriota bacterium]
MKRTAAIFLLSILSLSLSLAQEKKLNVIAESAEIFIEPSTSSTMIERVKKGTSLTLFGSSSGHKNWYYVSYYSKVKYATLSGYVQASQVELIVGKSQKAEKSRETTRIQSTASSDRAAAPDHGFGLGVLFGEPTGIGLKYWLGSRTAIDGGIAWSFSGDDSLHIHLDYLLHNFNLFKLKKGQLALYYGIGGRFKDEEERRIGVRVPVGIDYISEDVPMDIFFELAPVLDLVPGTELELMGCFGIRYFF